MGARELAEVGGDNGFHRGDKKRTAAGPDIRNLIGYLRHSTSFLCGARVACPLDVC